MGQRRLDVIVSGKNGALLRAAAPLESEQCGHIAAGQRCMVVDAATLDDGRERLLVRHATATGWCSAKVVRSVAGETVREDVDETRAAWLANAAVLRDMVRGMAARGPRAWSEGMEKALMAPLVVSEDDDVLIRRTKRGAAVVSRVAAVHIRRVVGRRTTGRSRRRSTARSRASPSATWRRSCCGTRWRSTALCSFSRFSICHRAVFHVSVRSSKRVRRMGPLAPAGPRVAARARRRSPHGGGACPRRAARIVAALPHAPDSQEHRDDGPPPALSAVAAGTVDEGRATNPRNARGGRLINSPPRPPRAPRCAGARAA